MVSIEIDGIKGEAPPGTMIIQVADALGIHIPRFCYHKKLSLVASCRMCLVEVANFPKPLPACATPITEGMQVFTASAKAKEAQQAVMEFLLINHPLDCPICDQGGECELQDVSLGYGGDFSRYQEAKRVVKDKEIGPLIATEMTRCIHCTRCVRFGTEIAGVRELGATGRGEHMEIGTFLSKSVDSELSGNIIDICPVGALTSLPYRFTARAWELHQHAGIAPHDCVGSHVYFHVASGKVKRVVPKECEAINETWLSDRDRFGYLGVESADRLLKPRIRGPEGWIETDWKMALEFLRDGFSKIPQGEIGGLISPSSTVEESFLFQKFLRQLGTPHVDHRIHHLDFSDEGVSSNLLGMNLSDLEHLEGVLLIGSNMRKEQPLLNHRIRKASLKGAEVVCINPIAYEFNFKVQQIVPEAGMLQLPLMRLAKAVLEATGVSTVLPHELTGVVPTAVDREIAKVFVQKTKKAIFLGPQAIYHPLAGVLRKWAHWIGQLISATIGELPVGANSLGASLAGAIPYAGPLGQSLLQQGLDARRMLEAPLRSYCLFNIEPEFDFANPLLLHAALKQADFVVGMTTYTTPGLEECAHVLLPVAAFCETSGTYVNVEGKWQSFQPAVPQAGEVQPGWKVLRAVGDWFGQKGFGYKTSEAVRDELSGLKITAGALHAPKVVEAKAPVSNPSHDLWVAERAVYAVDGVVRRSVALQQVEDARLCHFARVNVTTAKKYAVSEGDKVFVKSKAGRAALTLKVDAAVPDRVVYIPQGIPEVARLGAPYQSVELLKQEATV